MNHLAQHITEGVEVVVSSKYMQDYSSPDQGHFVFGYKIKITNNSPYTIQLLNRYWHIFDSGGQEREIEGEGVVGQQPILEPGQTHEYTSGCNLVSSMGRMQGHYEFIRLADQNKFKATIPPFNLIANFVLN